MKKADYFLICCKWMLIWYSIAGRSRQEWSHQNFTQEYMAVVYGNSQSVVLLMYDIDLYIASKWKMCWFLQQLMNLMILCFLFFFFSPSCIMCTCWITVLRRAENFPQCNLNRWNQMSFREMFIGSCEIGEYFMMKVLHCSHIPALLESTKMDPAAILSTEGHRARRNGGNTQVEWKQKRALPGFND